MAYQNSYSYQPRRDAGPRKNHQIRAQSVLLIDENNENVGEVPIQVAMSKAKEAEMDLVEVGSKANPPVVKIIDYSKYLYEQRKKLKKSKTTGKVKDLKEFRFSPTIAEGDIQIRVRRAKEYLRKGHNVRIMLFIKGRVSNEQAHAKFAEILTNFEGYSSIEPDRKKEGRKIFITFKADGQQK